MENYINNYVFKALDAFYYDLEETMESLNYALSYDDKNTMALTLMGRVYAEKLYKYSEAIEYYKEVLAININAFEVYSPYINVLLWNEDLKEAEDFIDFALTVKGSDKAMLHLKKAVVKEHQKKYKSALKSVKLAKEHSYSSDFMYTIDTNKDRIKEKMPNSKKKKTTKNNKKKKKK